MREFDAVLEKYSQAGISLDNIEYAATAVRFGSSADQIIENLKVGYKSLNDEQAHALLQDLFIANRIAIKKGRRIAFALGLFYFLTGFISVYYLAHVLVFGGVLHRPFFVVLAAVAGISASIYSFSRFLKANDVVPISNANKSNS
jgi:hypothetical protein